jgi:hypothetical protein
MGGQNIHFQKRQHHFNDLDVKSRKQVNNMQPVKLLIESGVTSRAIPKH